MQIIKDKNKIRQNQTGQLITDPTLDFNIIDPTLDVNIIDPTLDFSL